MILSSGREELRAIPTFSEFVRDLYVPFAMNAKRSWRTDETFFEYKYYQLLVVCRWIKSRRQ